MGIHELAGYGGVIMEASFIVLSQRVLLWRRSAHGVGVRWLFRRGEPLVNEGGSAKEERFLCGMDKKRGFARLRQ
jgi:hypothetical protein